MTIIKLILIIFSLLIVLLFLLAVYRTWKTQRGASQELFLSGLVPNPKPDGFYKGSVTGQENLPWKGKVFTATASVGLNKIDNSEKYKFQTSVGKGLQDKKLEVLKLEYNIAGNPFWLRTILDEIVEIKPGVYLGKVHVRLIPGFPFTLGYFNLEK